MIGWTNMADGGVNIQNGKAVIHVLARVGSTINFLKDGITIILKPDKSFIDIANSNFSHWYYSVSSSNYGTWTVMATLGTYTVSDTVTVDSNKEYDIKLNFLAIVKNGNLEATILSRTSGITDGTSGGRYVVSKTASGERVNIKYGTFDLSGKGYTKLVLLFDELSGSGDVREVGFEVYNSSNTRVAQYYHSTNTKYNTETTWQLDISAIDTTVSVAFGQFGNYSGTWTMRIKDFYFI